MDQQPTSCIGACAGCNPAVERSEAGQCIAGRCTCNFLFHFFPFFLTNSLHQGAKSGADTIVIHLMVVSLLSSAQLSGLLQAGDVYWLTVSVRILVHCQLCAFFPVSFFLVSPFYRGFFVLRPTTPSLIRSTLLSHACFR
jgi:hypothetical protein